MQITGHRICGGRATGPALVSKDAISFLGGVDPKTGVVIEKGHRQVLVAVHQRLHEHLGELFGGQRVHAAALGAAGRDP